MRTRFEKITALRGSLLGTAVGDALGLPAEGMSAARIRRRWRGLWRMRLIAGRGMFSDDTEHTYAVAQAISLHPRDETEFQRALAAKLRWWFLALPAGVGMATAKACLKLWLGIPSTKSGVFSAGNGPAMRSALIGVFFRDDAEKRQAFSPTLSPKGKKFRRSFGPRGCSVTLFSSSSCSRTVFDECCPPTRHADERNSLSHHRALELRPGLRQIPARL